MSVCHTLHPARESHRSHRSSPPTAQQINKPPRQTSNLTAAFFIRAAVINCRRIDARSGGALHSRRGGQVFAHPGSLSAKFIELWSAEKWVEAARGVAAGRCAAGAVMHVRAADIFPGYTEPYSSGTSPVIRCRLFDSVKQ